MSFRDLTSGGLTAHLPVAETAPALVAPASGNGFNTLRSPLIPIACWRMEDTRFAFDSSFPTPEAADELRLLAALMTLHPAAPISIFGHADPVGNDEYNKTLSGRRAMAIFAILTRNVVMWETLFSTPFGGDVWGEAVLSLIATDLGVPPNGPRPPRATMFKSYMDRHCRDASGQPFVLAPSDFLAGGADAGGKGDVQGCGEFNPIFRFSRAEDAELSRAEQKSARDEANTPNRRVTALLFRPGSRVSPDRWPCPRATEGPGGCRKRFFANAAARRALTEVRREHSRTHDTFACRFYDRLTHDSPCERVVKRSVFNYGLEQRRHLPWTEQSILRVVSEDGLQDLTFRMEQGSQAGTHRVFALTDMRPGIRYHGEIRDGQLILRLFETAELFALTDPNDAIDVLPMPQPEPETALPPVPPQDHPPFQGLVEPVDFSAVNDAAAIPRDPTSRG